MGIPVVRFLRKNGQTSWGRLEAGRIRPIPGPADSLAAFLKAKAWKQQPAQEFLDPASVELLPPVTAPCQIICQGKNYLDHILETGVKPENKSFNLLFSKADSTLAPGRGVVRRPEGVRLLDYELELGLVIGKEISGPVELSEENLGEYVAALVMANDVSARDVQIPERQWFKGKSFRGFCPVGPVLYLLDPSDLSRLYDLELELKVNGEVRQKANTRQLMHRPAETLSEISRIFDLRPGDLLLTGTPGGVAMKVKPKTREQEVADLDLSDKEKFARFIEGQEAGGRYLKEGDLVESTIRSADGVVDLGRQSLTIK